jgi:hypothetical protein
MARGMAKGHPKQPRHKRKQGRHSHSQRPRNGRRAPPNTGARTPRHRSTTPTRCSVGRQHLSRQLGNKNALQTLPHWSPPGESIQHESLCHRNGTVSNTVNCRNRQHTCRHSITIIHSPRFRILLHRIRFSHPVQHNFLTTERRTVATLPAPGGIDLASLRRAAQQAITNGVVAANSAEQRRYWHSIGSTSAGEPTLHWNPCSHTKTTNKPATHMSVSLLGSGKEKPAAELELVPKLFKSRFAPLARNLNWTTNQIRSTGRTPPKNTGKRSPA